MARPMSAMAKFARPNTRGVVLCRNLFDTLNGPRNAPVIWIQSPAGAGKTTLISSYLETSRIPCLWYQMDEGDSDLATFFCYLQQAVQSVQPPNEPSQLSLLKPEYLTGLPLFTRRFFERLFVDLDQQRVLVFDNYQTIADWMDFHGAFINGLRAIPPGKQVVIISREAPPGVFARFKAHDDMAVLTWENGKLFLSEPLAH